MGAVNQIVQPIAMGFGNIVQGTSDALTGALQPVEKAINKGVTDVGKTIANSPGLETAITAIAASYGVPPSVTAGFLAANKTSQTGGNLEKGLETFILSYGAGKMLNPGAIDLSSPEAIQKSAQIASQASVSNAAQNAVLDTLPGSVGTSLSNLAPAAMDAGGEALSAAVGGGGAAPAALTPAAIESGLGTAGYGVNASAVNSGLFNPATIGAGAGIGAAAMPAAGLSQAAINEAVASGNAPGSVGSALGQYLPADAAAAAAGTTGAGSALYDLASLGNINALNNLLNPSQTATNNTGNTNNGLSGTQLAALGTGAAGLYNASATRQAMQDALAAQQGFTNASTGTVTDLYNKSLGYNAPYQTLGTKAAGEISNEMPYLTHQFDVTDLYKGLAPNYDFMLQQGQQANLRAANVGGGMLGGNAQTGLNKFTQDYAGNAYQNAFTNYQNQRNNIYSNLANIAGIGQTANTAMGTAGTTLGNNIVGLNTNLSNATAANILGQAQVGAGGVTNAANTAFLATLLGQNTPTAGAATTPGSTSGFSLGDIAKLGSLGTGLGNAYAGIKSLFG